MNTVNTIHTRLYNKLAKLIPDLKALELGEAMKSLGGGGMMDLNLDVLYVSDDHTVVALSHYYKHPSGDLIADPDMEIRIFHDGRGAEALTYQDSLGYQRVYPDEQHVRPKLKKSLNSFLNTWLGNCLRQNHHLKREATKSK